MPWTFEDALDDHLVKVVSQDHALGLYELRISALETIVRIKLVKNSDSEFTHFQVSHSIQTPAAPSIHRTSHPFGDSPAHALTKAVAHLIDPYRDAIEAGYEPKETWLVENSAQQ